MRGLRPAGGRLLVPIESLERRMLLSGTAPNLPLGTIGTTPATDQSTVSLLQGHDSEGNFFSTPTNRLLSFNVASADNALSLAVTPINSGSDATGDLHVIVAPDTNGDGQLEQSELNQPELDWTAASDHGQKTNTVTLPSGGYFIQLSVGNFALASGQSGVQEADVNYSLSATAAAVTLPGIQVKGNGNSISDNASSPSTTNGTDFGTVQSGQAASTRQFTVTNTGGATLNLGSVNATGAFTVQSGLPPTLAGGASASFTIGLSDSSAGAKTGQVSFSTNVSGENPFQFSLAANVVAAPAPGISVSSNSTALTNGQQTPVDFGTVQTGQAAPTQQFTITNTGNATLDLGALSVTGAFGVQSGLPSTLNGGASANFTIALSDLSLGTKTGEVSFSTNVSGENPFQFPLTANVVAAPTPGVTVVSNGAAVASGQQTPVNLGTIQSGQAAPTQQFTVTNSGNATLNLGTLDVTGAFAVESGLPSTLSAGASANFTIALSDLSPGMKTGQASFSTNVAGENPFQFSVSANVVSASVPAVTVAVNGVQLSDGQQTPDAFSSVSQNAAGPSQTFTVQNAGGVTLTLGSVNVPGGFTVTTPLPSSLAPGASGSFTLTLGTASAGTFAGNVSFATNDPDHPNFTFPVTGTVNAVVSTPGVTITQVVPALPASVVGGGKTARGTVSVTITNTAAAAFSGAVTLAISASETGTPLPGPDLALGQLVPFLRLKAGAQKTVRVKVQIPAAQDNGSYAILATASGTGVSGGTSIAHSSSTIVIARPFVDLTGPGTLGSQSFHTGGKVSLTIPLTNQGNVAATGRVDFTLSAASGPNSQVLTPVTSIPGVAVNLKPAATRPLKLKFVFPTLPAGNYFLTAQLNGEGALGAMNYNDGQVIATIPIVVT